MRIVKTLVEARECLRALPPPQGLVPTMGYLHDGHLSLVRRARGDNKTATATIFVNPTQFGPNEDFSSYPRDLSRDLKLLEREGVDVVFVPDVDEMYAPGNQTVVSVGGITERLEGASRPGHFNGVATVVTKLFNVMQPDRAYFGQKDAQQTLVIKRLTTDLKFPIEIVVLPTVREADGLALSSRNAYLSAEQREGATVLIRALRKAEALYESGERDAQNLRAAMLEILGAEPLADVDYVSVADSETLSELDQIDSSALASMAVRIGRTRLIDNIQLRSEH